MTEETATAPETEVQPEESQADVSQETPEPETAESTEVDSAEVSETPERKPDPKLAELAYNNRELKRQIKHLTQLMENQAKAAPVESKAPKIEDFETIEDYVQAEIKHSLEQSQPDEPAPEVTETDDRRDDLIYEGLEKYDDFEAVAFNPEVRITPTMADAILELDSKVDVAYYLGNHPNEARKIAKLSEVGQIGALVKLQNDLAAKPAKETQPSTAPKPIKPVSGSQTTETEIQETEDYESFLKKRNRQLGRG